jgi:Ca2+-binding EF-hand superfamily protein
MIQQMLQQMFQKTDTDGNGSVSLAEFKAGAKSGPGGAQASQGAPDLSQVFTKMDTNGDGTLSADEFSTGFQSMHDEAKTTLLNAQEQSGMPSIEDMFASADTNGDGSLSEAEFAAAAPQGPPPGPPPGGGAAPASGSTDDSSSNSSSTVFDSLDTNQDGKVSLEEMLAGAEKKKAAQGTTSDQTQLTSDQSAALLNILKEATELYASMMGSSYTRQAQSQTQSVIA